MLLFLGNDRAERCSAMFFWKRHVYLGKMLLKDMALFLKEKKLDIARKVSIHQVLAVLSLTDN